MSVQSPLGRVLGSGSAKEGTDHFWAQRLSAMGLVLLVPWFIIVMVSLESYEHASVVAMIESPFNTVMLVLLCLTLGYHSSLGIQVIIEDYVHGPFIKVLSLVLSKFAHIFVTIAALFAILRIAFGGAA